MTQVRRLEQRMGGGEGDRVEVGWSGRVMPYGRQSSEPLKVEPAVHTFLPYNTVCLSF